MAPRLSLREREVVQLVGEGKTSKEVAATLGMSLKTAETHRSNILMKLNLHSTVELVLYAVQNDIVNLVHFPMVVPRAPQNGNRHAQIAV
jgi:DNA-binding CsgD family transcriptional regulator